LTAADRSAEGSGDLLSPSPQAEHPERREHQTRPTSADDWPGTGAKELPMPSLKISYSYRADGQPVLRI